MTVNGLLEAVTALRGQQYGTHEMVAWLNEIEGKAVEDVINRAEGYDEPFRMIVYEEDGERELSIPDRFRDVYINYMLAKVDFFNQETERYNNDVLLYNAAWEDYAAWFIRTHMPKPAKKFPKF